VSVAQLRRRMDPRRREGATARGMRDKPPLACKDIESEQPPAAIADVAQPARPPSSRAAVARRGVPPVRFGLAAGGIVAAAGVSVLVQRNPATDPVAAAIVVVREFSEIALSKAF